MAEACDIMGVGMEIKISRHARRRLELYNIDEFDVVETVNREIKGGTLGGSRRSIVNQDLAAKYGYPLKVVCAQEGVTVTVISAYPVRKERKK